MFTSNDQEKFRALRITHVAATFEALIGDESNDDLTPEQLFLTAVDDALEIRRANRVERLIRQAKFPIPHASIAEIDYRKGRGISPVLLASLGLLDGYQFAELYCATLVWPRARLVTGLMHVRGRCLLVRLRV